MTISFSFLGYGIKATAISGWFGLGGFPNESGGLLEADLAHFSPRLPFYDLIELLKKESICFRPFSVLVRVPSGNIPPS